MTETREYERLGELTACTYCGQIAETVDHVPPTVSRPHIIALGLAQRYRFVEVPACRECNSALGFRTLWTVPERKRWIKGWLRRRYRRYLSIPPWDDGELGRLGPNLQRHVIAGLHKRRIVQDRLAW